MDNTLEDTDSIVRAQIDTGAFVSCTGLKHIIHNYREFSPRYLCPIHMQPVTQGSDAIPEGVGYLHVPCPNAMGFLPVRTYYHPMLRTTVIDERDFIRASVYAMKIFSLRVFAHSTTLARSPTAAHTVDVNLKIWRCMAFSTIVNTSHTHSFRRFFPSTILLLHRATQSKSLSPSTLHLKRTVSL